MPFTIHRVSDPKSQEFDALVAIYLAAHPASERKPVELLCAMVQRPDYLFLTVKLDQAVVGFSIVNLFPQLDASYLEYFAVVENRRGQGIGQFLFQQIAARSEVVGRFMIVEVDSDKLPSPLQKDNSRRKRFYRNLGCREVAGLDYLMPSITAHTPPPMDILVYGRTLPEAVAKSRLRSWLQALYVGIYAMQATDIRINRMLDDLPQNLDLL